MAFFRLVRFLNWHPSDSTLPQCHTGGRGLLAPSFFGVVSHVLGLNLSRQLLGSHGTPGTGPNGKVPNSANFLARHLSRAAK